MQTKYDVESFGKKSNEPKLTQKQFCNQLGFSESTIRRYRDDINMDSRYIRKIYTRTNTKSSTSIIETRNHTPSEKTKNNKNNEKNDLKVGSSLEMNQQEDSTNFVTIARRMVDNV